MSVNAGRPSGVDYHTAARTTATRWEQGSAFCVSFEVTRPSDDPDDRKIAAKQIVRFAALTFLITLGTGLLVVLSDHAQLVNGARPVQHSLSLPMPIAVALIVLGGCGTGLAAICVTAWESGRPVSGHAVFRAVTDSRHMRRQPD